MESDKEEEEEEEEDDRDVVGEFSHIHTNTVPA